MFGLLLVAIYVALALAVAYWLRHRFAWAQRLNNCHWRLLTLVDEIGTTLVILPLHLLGASPQRPLVGETLSSLAYWYEQMSPAWGKVRRVIDALFLLTGERDHCRKAFEKWVAPLNYRE